MTEAKPFMTDEETAFLEANLAPSDRVFEWGSGASTLWLRDRVRSIVSVEHQRRYAEDVLSKLDGSGLCDVSLYFIPPNLSYTEGTEDDGTHETFRDYVSCYTGRGITAVIIDGRARVACARWIAECSTFGPDPDLRVFLHDAQREQYAPIWKDDAATGHRAWFVETGRAGNLVMLAPRLEIASGNTLTGPFARDEEE